MRDYKNVKVPRKYRAGASRVSVKRATTRRAARNPSKTGRTVKQMALNAILIAAAAGSCFLAWKGYCFATHAPMFQISGVDVKGVRRLGETDLKNIAGEFTGQNIFRADLESAIRRARANPWVREVRIHRALPNRITIELAERVPYAVLETGAGTFLIDRDAVAIDRAEHAPGTGDGLPKVSTGDCRPRPGEPLASENVNDALDLLSEIAARGGWNPADIAIRAYSPEALSVVYAGREFRIGSGRYPEKLRRLAEVMEDVKRRSLDIAYVDLRPESQAAVMVKNGNTVREADGGGGKKAPDNRRRARAKHRNPDR